MTVGDGIVIWFK